MSTILFFLFATAISYGTEENKVTHEADSFPIWGWFIFVGIIVCIYACYRYCQYLWQEFNYNITSKYSLGLSIIPLILFGYYYFGKTVGMRILGMNAFLFLFIISISIFYILQLKKNELAVSNHQSHFTINSVTFHDYCDYRIVCIG
jgi:hypothetical protein